MMKSSDAFLVFLAPILVTCFDLDEMATSFGVPQLFEEAMSNREVECGLPSFTNSLPLQSRRNLRKIWANFPLGSKSCSVEIRQTQAVLDSLPSDLKQRTLRNKHLVPKTTALLPGTPFLASLSNSQQKELSQIAADTSLSEAEKVVILKAWAVEHLSPNVHARFEQTLRFLSAKANRFQEKVAAMSAEARMALNRLEDLRRQKISILNRLSVNAKRELAILWKPKCNSSEGVDPDFFLIACTNKQITSQPIDTTTTVESSTKASTWTSIKPINMSTTMTTQASPSILNETTVMIENTTTNNIITTSTLRSTSMKTLSPEIEIFRRQRPEPISSPYKVVTQKSVQIEKKVPSPAPVVLSASLPPSVFSTMDSNQLSAILRRIFPNSHFRFKI